MSVNPDLDLYMGIAGMIDVTTGEPDRAWFQESVERSRRAIEFAKGEQDRELTQTIREGYGDRTDVP